MKKRLKALAAICLVCGVMAGTSITSLAAGWKSDDKGWWWQNDDNSYIKSAWHKDNGKWYYFKEDGYMAADLWIQIPRTINDEYGEYTVEEWFYLDASGAMDTSGKWEGGEFRSDGAYIPYVTYVDTTNNKLTYYVNDARVRVQSSLLWKENFAKALYANIGNQDHVGTYTMDYQFPANWMEECPKPLIEELIGDRLSDCWAGGSWSYTWQVDSNHVIHISATFNGYE